MEEFQNGRKFLKSKTKDIPTVKGLINYAKLLLGSSRNFWQQPQNDEEITPIPQTWIEELILVGYKINSCAKQNMKQFCAENLQDQFVAILCFAAAQIKQLDVIQPVVDSVVQTLSCPDIIIPFYVYNKNLNAVTLLLQVFHSTMSDASLLAACLFLAKNKSTSYHAEKYIDRLAPKYPKIVASLRACLLTQSAAYNENRSKCQEALGIITSALTAYPDDPQLLFNAAILCIKLYDKKNASLYAQKALIADPSNPHIILLLMKILRSNCNFEAALELADRSPAETGRWDKFIVIEAMFIAAEIGNMPKMEGYFQRLKKYWRRDGYAMSSTVRLNLMLGKLQSASECFQIWAEFDQQSADFFFCYSELCVASQDFAEAEKNLYFAIEADSDRAEYHAALALVLQKRGKKDMALERAKFATELEPNNIHPWLALASVSTGEINTRALKKVQEIRCNTIELGPLDIMLVHHETLIHSTE